MTELFIGIILGACVFAATLFSGAQIYRQSGALRWAHLASLVLTLTAMGTLSAAWPNIAAANGAWLVVAALAALIYESGWNRVLPVFQMVFGAALVAGLPFGV